MIWLENWLFWAHTCVLQGRAKSYTCHTSTRVKLTSFYIDVQRVSMNYARTLNILLWLWNVIVKSAFFKWKLSPFCNVKAKRGGSMDYGTLFNIIIYVNWNLILIKKIVYKYDGFILSHIRSSCSLTIYLT